VEQDRLIKAHLGLLQRFVLIQNLLRERSLVIYRGVAADVPQIQVGYDGKGKENQEEQGAWSVKQDENQVGGRDDVPQGSGSSANRDERGFGKEKWHEEIDKSADIPYCDRCREYGHLIRDCWRGQAHGGQNPQVARDLSLSEYITPLCAAQVDG
jgi:hypothetical protein